MPRERSEKVWNWLTNYDMPFIDMSLYSITLYSITLCAKSMCSRLLSIVLLQAGLLLVPVDARAAKGAANNAADNAAEVERANRLAGESSPYLLQHAYNAVDWYPWGEEAFQRARREDKPIFLSIGYASCHWCHVMARESFDNEKIAEFLNKHFISIKVDREQRPDIDAVYLVATRKMNGYAGWPMTVFIDDKRRPFHTGVYYPPFSVDGHTGFYTVITSLHEKWRNDRERVELVSKQLSDYIVRVSDETAGSNRLDNGIRQKALQAISEMYHEDSGGFSDAPKFFSPGIHRLLVSEADTESISMSRTTLDNIIYGGIHDQLGGGFHRYAVDDQWLLPHFEKMLYSQALIARALLDLIETGKLDAGQTALYRNTVRSTLDFVLRDMRHPGGAFIAALDAQSKLAADMNHGQRQHTSPDDEQEAAPGWEYAEGAYYLWSLQGLESVLNDEELALFKRYYAIEDDGNIALDPTGRFAGRNILYVGEMFRQTLFAEAQQLDASQATLLSRAREKLFSARSEREPPARDDKVITAWNAMMISVLARASVILQDKTYMQAARQALAYLRAQHYDEAGGILYRQRYGNTGHDNDNGVVSADTDAATPMSANRVSANRVTATLADYTWLIRALLTLHDIEHDEATMGWAVALQAQQDRTFHDAGSGSYYDFAEDDEGADLLFRSRTISDGHLPSANAIAVHNLMRFSQSPAVRDKAGYRSRASKLIESFAGRINDDPVSAASLLAVSPSRLLDAVSE